MAENMTYDASNVLADVKEEDQEKLRELVYAWSTRLEWGLTDYELSNIARRFIHYVQEGKTFSAAVVLDFLEDINYHRECSDFVDGKAADYIMSSLAPHVIRKRKMDEVHDWLYWSDKRTKLLSKVREWSSKYTYPLTPEDLSKLARKYVKAIDTGSAKLAATVLYFLGEYGDGGVARAFEDGHAEDFFLRKRKTHA